MTSSCGAVHTSPALEPPPPRRTRRLPCAHLTRNLKAVPPARMRPQSDRKSQTGSLQERSCRFPSPTFNPRFPSSKATPRVLPPGPSPGLRPGTQDHRDPEPPIFTSQDSNQQFHQLSDCVNNAAAPKDTFSTCLKGKSSEVVNPIKTSAQLTKFLHQKVTKTNSEGAVEDNTVEHKTQSRFPRFF